MNLSTHSFEETVSLGEKIGNSLRSGDIVALSGPLGSGKTSFVKGIAQAMNIEEIVTSPSFTLISEYSGRMPLYHMDLYRVDSAEEFELLGGEELMYGDGVTIIEWAEKMEEYLPPDIIYLDFKVRDDGKRDIEIRGIDV